MNNLTTNSGAWKTEYQQRAEQTQARRRAKGMYRRPTKAQEAAYRKSLMRGGDKNLTVEEMELLATYPYFAASQREQYAIRANVRRSEMAANAVAAA